MSKYISYLRVSTQDQHLGIEAQRLACQRYLRDGHVIIREVEERESGRRNDRPALDEALRLCRLHRATLLVAKLDRLARNAEFLRRILRESGERGVVFCDMPNIPEGPTGKFLIGMMAEVAELEAGMISQRTKAALAVVKKTKQLGGLRSPEHAARWKEIADASRPLAWQARRTRTRAARAEIMAEIEKLQAAGRTTLRAIAEGLNAQGVATPKGGQWSPTQVQRVLHSRVLSTKKKE